MPRRVIPIGVLAQDRAVDHMARAMRRIARAAAYGLTDGEAQRLGISLDALWSRHLLGGTVRPATRSSWAAELNAESGAYVSRSAPGLTTLPPHPAHPVAPEAREGPATDDTQGPGSPRGPRHAPTGRSLFADECLDTRVADQLQRGAEDLALRSIGRSLAVLAAPGARIPGGSWGEVGSRAAELLEERGAALLAPEPWVPGWGLPSRRDGYAHQGSGVGRAPPKTLSERERRALWPTAGPTRDCGEGRWVTFRCGNPACGQEHKAWAGCTRLDCTLCRDAVSQQRAARAWDGHGDVADKWGACVLTVEPELRHRIRVEDRRKWARAAWECVRDWLHAEGQDGELGGLVWFHPVGSRWACPESVRAQAEGGPLPAGHLCAVLGEDVRGSGGHVQWCEGCGQQRVSVDSPDWHPHWNVLLPLVRVTWTMDTDGNPVGRGHHVRHWHDDKTGALDRLRASWAAAQAALLGIRVDDVRPQAHWDYKQGPEHIRHAFRYFGRSFPGWSAWTNTRGGNAYGGLHQTRNGPWYVAIASTLGIFERPLWVWVCACGGQMRCVGLGSPMTWADAQHARPPERGRDAA